MSDRKSPVIYASIFNLLGSDPTKQHKAWAKELWEDSQLFDFSPDTMRCEDALRELGLARWGIDPNYPEEGEVWLYGVKDEETQ